jgi:hypothetical protein
MTQPVTAQQAAEELGFPTDNYEVAEQVKNEDAKKPCPECGKMLTWLADGSRPRAHKCEPNEPVQTSQPVQQTAPAGKITPSIVIAKVVEDRDKIAELKKEFDSKVEELKNLQEKRLAWLHSKLDELGVDSFKTEFGTCFKTKKDSATVKDKEVFFDWVYSEWDTRKHFIKKGVDKMMVKERVSDGETPPPGIDYTTFIDIGVRRA